MSPGRKHKAASTLRSDCVEGARQANPAEAKRALVLPVKATEDGRESRGSPPAHKRAGRYRCAPDDLSRILQSKGFAGGVPLNTERTTVKPWVGI
jgi:hypothetical protein